ncbi:MAG TPA: hypothetical protein DIS95_13850 [Proteus vulgaris]|nr:hypothetical protein EGX81_11865 [Proteus vulgaris]HCN43463.1 hypothetical protein [Proteus vulgaris]
MEHQKWQDKPVKEINATKPKQSDYIRYNGDGLELFVIYNNGHHFCPAWPLRSSIRLVLFLNMTNSFH